MRRKYIRLLGAPRPSPASGHFSFDTLLCDYDSNTASRTHADSHAQTSWYSIRSSGSGHHYFCASLLPSPSHIGTYIVRQALRPSRPTTYPHHITQSQSTTTTDQQWTLPPLPAPTSPCPHPLPPRKSPSKPPPQCTPTTACVRTSSSPPRRLSPPSPRAPTPPIKHT